MKFTEKTVRALPPTGPTERDRVAVRDPDLPGFMVVRGQKHNVYKVQVQQRTLAGKRQDKTKVLGRVGMLSLAEARAAAMLFIGQHRGKKAEDTAVQQTLKMAFDDMRARKLVKARAKKTVDQYDYCIDILRPYWDTPLTELSARRREVQEFHAELTEKRGPATANDVFKILRAIYQYATLFDDALPARHPAYGITWNKRARRQQGLSVKELPGWFAAWAETTCPLRREYYLMQLLSGLRPTSLSEAKWEHLDREKRALHIPKPKGGTERAFHLPLSTAMLDSLAWTRDLWEMIDSTSPYIYPNPASAKEGIVRSTKQDRARMEVDGKLRQTWATQAETIGVPKLHRMIILNHKKRDVSDGYVNNSALWEPVLATQERMSEHLLKLSANFVTLLDNPISRKNS